MNFVFSCVVVNKVLGTNVVPINVIHETSTEVLLKFGAERVSKCKVQYSITSFNMRPYHCTGTFVLNSDVAYLPYNSYTWRYRYDTVPGTYSTVPYYTCTPHSHYLLVHAWIKVSAEEPPTNKLILYSTVGAVGTLEPIPIINRGKCCY